MRVGLQGHTKGPVWLRPTSLLSQAAQVCRIDGEKMALKTGCRFPSEPVRSNYRLTETGDTREGGGMLPLSCDSHTHSVHLGHGSLWQLLHGLYQAQQV